MEIKQTLPNVLELSGSFGYVGSVDQHAFIDFVEAGCLQLDTVIRDDEAIQPETMQSRIPRTIQTVADGALTPAELRIVWDASTGMPPDPLNDTIIEATGDAAIRGALGNTWQIVLLADPIMPSAFIIEDAVNLVVYIFIKTGVGGSTIGDVETAIGGATYIQVQQSSALIAEVCTAADSAVPQYLAGGEDGLTIDVAGSDTAGYVYTVHFEDGVSTVAELEAAVTALGGGIEVATAGTGASVLAAADDEVGPLLLRSPTPDIKTGEGYVVYRLTGGAYGTGLPAQYIIVFTNCVGYTNLAITAALTSTTEVGKYVILGTLLPVPNVGYYTTAWVYTTAGAASDLDPTNDERVNFVLEIRK
jgi:hypothetical protein